MKAKLEQGSDGGKRESGSYIGNRIKDLFRSVLVVVVVPSWS
jgi:hypothetical protein